ncbi:tRNA-specific adenosine deaminase [Lachnellula suecica]|uniref:tRNA-specific adenosine deaminase n=1 Tax=Lachnellula suecica TaxID=602035 RepID=A0A8T9CIN5_9HELO|nr:tRNA-specific adenosine deaminase [Lachnellula suecica]
MLYPLSILSVILLALIHLSHGSKSPHSHAHQKSTASLDAEDTIPFEIRAYWMRKANEALSELFTPCPFAAFGTVVVNHTDTSSPLGELVCMSVNQNEQTGNPTLHGEIAAINNCSAVLAGKGLSPAEIGKAWKDLSLYTNGEPCPMCASAIRWSGFKECIYGTSIETLFNKGWGQISISTEEVFEESAELPGRTRLIGNVLANETDPYFSWQFDGDHPCPKGCGRKSDGFCGVIEGKTEL